MADTMPRASDESSQARPGDRTKRVGAYAKLLANYASDDALIEAGESAELLFVRGLAFCATSDSDGFITDAQVSRYVGAGMRDALKRAEKLAKVGVWQRLDGGYLVRSWTKIHETTVEKGRRRKADRERKRKQSESGNASEPIPDGIQAEGTPESLSLIHDNATHDSARHDTTDEEPQLLGERTETLRSVPATTPQKAEATCSAHPDGDPGDMPCVGCKRVNERKQREADRAAERAAKEADELRRNCPKCEGCGKVLNDDKIPTTKRCDHVRPSQGGVA